VDLSLRSNHSSRLLLVPAVGPCSHEHEHFHRHHFPSILQTQHRISLACWSRTQPCPNQTSMLHQHILSTPRKLTTSSSLSVWNRGGKQNNSTTSRTPQNRSSTASPIPQAPKQDNSNNNSRSQTPANNAWATPRNSSVSGSNNGPSTSEQQTHIPANGFNSAEVKQFLSRGAVPTAYKAPQTGGGSAPWAGAVQSGSMSTGQAFFPNLNKQVAAFENGG